MWTMRLEPYSARVCGLLWQLCLEEEEEEEKCGISGRIIKILFMDFNTILSPTYGQVGKII